MLTSTTQRFLVAAVVGLLSTTALFAQDSIPSERRLPPNVLAFVTCPDVNDLQARLQDTAYGGLLNDPEMQEFRDEFMQKFDEMSKKAEEEIGMPLSDLTALLSGEATLAVVRPIGQMPGVVAMLDCGDHDDIVKSLLEKVDAGLKEQGAEGEIENVDGTDVTVYTLPQADGQKTPATVTYFYKDHVFVIGSSLSVLETVLERWDGSDDKCFANSELYQEMLKQCVPDANAKPVMKWFVTPIELIMAGMSMSPETQMYAGIGSAYLPTLGLNKLKALGGATELATEEFDSVSRSVVIANPPASGLIKVFQFPDSLTGPPAWVPHDAAQYIALHWDIGGAYDAIGAMYDTFQGSPGAWNQLVDSLSDQPGGPGLHIKNDVIDTLTGVGQGYLVIPPGTDINAADFQPRGVVAIGVTDSAKAETLLRKILAEENDFTERKFNDHTVFELAGSKTAAAAVVNNEIILAEDVQRLESVIIGRTGNPLSETPQYKRMAAYLPEKFSTLSWVDPAVQWEAGYEKLRGGAFDNIFDGSFDPAVLPPFAVVKKYMRQTAAYSRPTERGYITTSFSLRPEKK
ncbi:MAG: hypothetical protein KDA66_01275 [Planctomycetaceae bacterium]|nr:hypothetical protein [Planctomycetaceae bacterium]